MDRFRLSPIRGLTMKCSSSPYRSTMCGHLSTTGEASCSSLLVILEVEDWWWSLLLLLSLLFLQGILDHLLHIFDHHPVIVSSIEEFILVVITYSHCWLPIHQCDLFADPFTFTSVTHWWCGPSFILYCIWLQLLGGSNLVCNDCSDEGGTSS